MARRGRGLLEVKSSSNPFFQSTASDIGTIPTRTIKWTGDVDPAMMTSHTQKEDTFSFLYSRESDTIGSMVRKPVLEKKELLTKTEFLKKRRETLREEMGDTVGNGDESETVFKVTAEQVLAQYRHVPKLEDPRFMTTSVSFTT